MYMMTYSELPVFMTCGNGQSWYQVDGPGGIPPGSTMAPESPAVWRPPPSAGAGAFAGDGLAFGQIAGALYGRMPWKRRLFIQAHVVCAACLRAALSWKLTCCCWSAIGMTGCACRAGVAHSLDGETLWVVHRGPRVWDERTYASDGERLSAAILEEGPISTPTVVQLHKETGEVTRAWGQGALYLPHSVVTDRDGNVWVTDTGLHQVDIPLTLCSQHLGPRQV